MSEVKRIPKTTAIIDDYEITSTVLGLGINGKVVECWDKKTKSKYALKVLHDNAKARREVELHWRASGCRYVNVIFLIWPKPLIITYLPSRVL